MNDFEHGKELWRRFRRVYNELKTIAHEINDLNNGRRIRRGRRKRESMLTLLNTSIITTTGRYEMREITLADAQKFFPCPYQSAIGHEATAQVLSELLRVPVSVNRIMYVQQPGERAIVFKLRGRVEEGKILNREEIEAIGYDLFVLTREA